MANRTLNKVVWPAVVAGFGVAIAIGAVAEIRQGSPTAEWLPRLGFAVLFVLWYLLWKVGLFLEDENESSGMGLSDWTSLIGIALWMIAGFVFVYLGWGSPLVIFYTVIGALGVLAIIYGSFQNRNTESAVE